MSVDFRCLTIHVLNVWQTCEWCRMVFGFLSVTSADATATRLDVPGHRPDGAAGLLTNGRNTFP